MTRRLAPLIGSLILLPLIVVSVSGCGNKGPLYLPAPDTAQESTQGR